MAFALVNFYEENMWDVIPTSDIILNDGEASVREGMKTFVHWRGKGRTVKKVPAEISTISDDKDYLMRVMRGDECTPSKQGKGCRKRTVNAKYIDDEDEDEDEKPVQPTIKRVKSSHKMEERNLSDNLTKLIKARHQKESELLGAIDHVDDRIDDHDTIVALKQKVKALTRENHRLKEQIANSQDLQMSIKKLKKFVGMMEDFSSARVPGLSTPRANSSSPKMLLHSPAPRSPAPRSPASIPPTNLYSSASQSPSSQSSAPHSPASNPPTNSQSPSPHSPAPHSPVSQSPAAQSPAPHSPTASPLPVCLLQDLDSSEAAKQLISLGPGLKIRSKVFQRLKAKKVGSYVANIMSATLSREYMATHSYKGQKAKNGLIKPKIDLEYASSMIAHCKSIKFSDMGRDVIKEDIVKAIKYKLNNEEQGWKKQNESDDGIDKKKTDN